MKRRIVLIIGAVLMMTLITKPVPEPRRLPLITPLPVMHIPALIYIEADEEPATPSSLPVPPEPEPPEPEPELPVYDNEWAFYLVDRHNPLPNGFEITLYPLGGEDEWWRAVDERIADYALQMLEDARLAGVNIVIIEGYRTIERQQEIYDRRVNYFRSLGLNELQAVLLTDTEVARPGASEHNAGIAIDFASGSYDPYSFEYTAEFRWLSENAHNYGFILRYPDDALHITGFIYEPWHWRFVGVMRAHEIYESELTLEEYITATDDTSQTH